MEKDTVIKAEHISKKFCSNLQKSVIYGVGDIARNLVGMSTRSGILRKGEFWAVDDASFELKRGESLGIMGLNGSGKSTIFKMIDGIMMPDKGIIEVKGKVSALIEVGAGFHPMLSGRENIYVGGAILGMSKKEIDQAYDSIVDFANIGNFIDAPVKTYSSGMYVRLGFAVAVHCNPDILLVDEVLAVGDREFQLKCYRKMHEMKKRDDISIMMISHNEYAIREYCQRCIILYNGKILFCGETEDTISFYFHKLLNDKKINIPIEGSSLDKGIIKEVVFSDSMGNQINKIPTGQKIIIDFHYKTTKEIRSPIFGITFYNSMGLFTGFWNSYENVKLPDIQGVGVVRVVVEPFDLPIDSYCYDVVVCEEDESNVLEWKDMEREFLVDRPSNTRGSVKLEQTWDVIK